MRRTVWAAALGLAAFVSSGCGGGEVQEGQAPPVVHEAPVEVPRPEGPPPLYDGDGNLLESEQLFAWLTLPRGLEPVLEVEGRSVFRTEVPLFRVQRYFGPRLLTGAVERRGAGIVYQGALPRSIPPGARPRRIDVSVTNSSGGGVRIELIAQMPRREVVDPAAQRRRVRESLERLD